MGKSVGLSGNIGLLDHKAHWVANSLVHEKQLCLEICTMYFPTVFKGCMRSKKLTANLALCDQWATFDPAP